MVNKATQNARNLSFSVLLALMASSCLQIQGIGSAPTLSSPSPNFGSSTGGTLVTITGDHFKSGALVSLGGSPCVNVHVNSPQSLSCMTTAHPVGVVDLVVVNFDTQTQTLAQGFTFEGPPIVSSVSPISGAIAGSTTITITGAGFMSGATVALGSGSCSSVNVISPTSLTCLTPAESPGVVSVTVTNPDTQSGTLASSFTYNPAPTVSSVSPNNGALAGGTTITISGSNFLPGAISAAIGGTPCTSPVYLSATSMTCVTPANVAGTYTAVVTNPDGEPSTAGGGFTYNPLPTVTSISPTSGTYAGGTSVTFTGTGFISGALARINGIACTSTTFVSSTTLTCIAPAGAPGSYGVSVTNPDGQISSGGPTYSYIGFASLQWQVGAASPTPPNPDNFGSTNTSVTHTLTLKNVGNIASSSITITITGETGYFGKSTDNCSGTTLAAGATCTVSPYFYPQMTNGNTAGAHNATLQASATTGGTTTNSLTGTAVYFYSDGVSQSGSSTYDVASVPVFGSNCSTYSSGWIYALVANAPNGTQYLFNSWGSSFLCSAGNYFVSGGLGQVRDCSGAPSVPMNNTMSWLNACFTGAPALSFWGGAGHSAFANEPYYTCDTGNIYIVRAIQCK